MNPTEKVYLGDGAYVTFDGHGIILTAENGIRATDVVYLEPSTLKAFEDYLARLREALKR